MGNSANNPVRCPNKQPLQVRLSQFLNQYLKARALFDEPEERVCSKKQSAFEHLLTGYRSAVAQWSREQKSTAKDFNLLEVMNLTKDEICHSMLLAWLLDRDIRRFGTHAQGSLGFRLFLEECGLPVGYATANYDVRREVAGDQSRIDVRVEARGRFIVDIENKITSSLLRKATTKPIANGVTC